MTLLEYVDSLFQQNVPEDEIVAKTQEWKKKNQPEEEAKINDVADKKDATVTSTPDASKAIEKITGQSKFGTGPSSLPDPKQSFDLVGRTAKQVSGVTPIFQGVDLNPGETKTANKFDFKYEVGEDKQPVFYTKPEGQEDWINVTANKAKNPDAELGAAEELGFNVGDFDREKALSQKIDREDFNIGEYLDIDKSREEIVIFDASNIKGLTKDGEMLTAEELFFKNKARPSRYADSFVDKNFEEKELKKQNKKPLDSKVKDYIVVNELNLNNKYEQFKNQEYSGDYKEDFNPDAAIATINSDYNSNLLSGLSNFNYNDFVGFYNNKGYSEDYFDNVMNPNQGYDVVEISIKQKLESETDPTAIKSLKDQLNSSKTNRQRYLNDRLNNYIDEKEDEYAKKLYSAYILKNPEEFKDIKSTDKAFAKAKKYFDDKYGEFGYGLFNYNEIESYKKLAFPELTAANAEALAIQQRKINRIKSENTLGSDLYLAAQKAARGYVSGAQEIATGIQDIFGIDNTYQRSVIEERDIKRQAEDVGYQFVMGKEAEIDGITYIKDEVGNIYDTTNKTILGSVSKEKLKKINNALDNSKETGSSFSTMGSLQEFAAVGGRMAYDIIGTSLTGGAFKALGVTKLTNALRIPEATVGAMGYYGASGYFGTKQNTYNQFIKAGVNKDDAGKMSDLAARYGAALYALTSAIAPNSKYVDNLNTNLFGTSTTSRLIKDAINGYKRKGVSGAGVSIFERLKRFMPTKQGVVSTISDGVFEVGQETLQQGLEIYGLNPYLNKLAQKDILQETMTSQDFANLWMTSFGSGSVFANLNLRGFGPRNARQQLQSLYQIGQDLAGSRKIMNDMVVSGDITTEQMSNVLSDVRAVHNQMNKIPDFVSDETKLESAKLQQEIADLQEKKKRTSEAYQPAIDELINKKKQELAEIVKPELEKAAARKGSKIAAEQLGAGFENFSTQQDMDSAAESLTEDGWEVQDSTGYGMALTKGKQKIILINDQAAAEDNRYTTDQHEVLHPFWEAALKANPKAAIDLGKALMVEIINNKDINAGTELLSRFSAYLSDENYSAENTWEEVIPLVSEALSNGDITYNKKQEAWWKNLGTKISDFLKGNKKPLSLEFNTGKDVFDFIEGYNKSIEAGKGLTKEQLEVAEKGAKGKLIEEGFDKESTYAVKEGETIQDVADKFDTTVQNLKDLNKTSGTDLKAGDNLIVDAGVEIVERASDIKAAQQVEKDIAKESKRVEDSQEVQKLYDEQGVSAAFDIIQKFKPITSRIVESRSQAPNFDRQLLTDEIETGPRGILDLISEYKPESGVPLAAFINKFLPARSIEASKRVLGEEFTTDVTEAKGVVAEETTKVETKEKPIAKKPTETVEFSQAQIEKIGAKNKAEVETKITEATKKSFKDQDVKTFGQTRNVPKAVADIYAGMFGLNPQTITDKTRNYQKTDAEGLTTAKQFLLKNANNDFSRLPKTKDGFGKGTFLPRNVMNALYTNGKLTGTLKDYINLIRQKPVKPIYRDAVGQTIRGLLNLHIRNRMFEDLVTTTAERAVGGAKFSKRINTEQQIFEDKKLNDLFKSVSQARSIIDVAKIIGVKGKITVNDSNRAQKQEQMLDFIKVGNIPSAVFEMAKFQNFARRKVNGVYVDLPARGGLYYGKLDPAYQAALNAAKENDSKYPDLAKPKRVNVNKAFTKKGINQSKENTKFLNSFVNILNDAVNKNGLPIEIAALYITSGYQATTGIIKIAAPFKYKSTKFEYAGPGGKGSDNKGEKFREEHTIPASVIGANIILAIQKNAVKPTMKAIEKNYFQVQLSKKDDTKLDKAGLGSTLFENQTIFDSPISRLAGAGINLQTIINPLNGKTIAEENGVGIESKVYNSLNIDGKTQASAIQNEQIKKGTLEEDYNVKKAIDLLVPLSENKAKASKRNSNTQPDSLQEGFVSVEKSIENLEVLDNALNQARRPEAPVKKIRVFDFDDTLARSKSMVIVNMPVTDVDLLDIAARRKFKKQLENLPSREQTFDNLTEEQQAQVLKEVPGATRKINATEFAAQAADLEAQGATFDFTEFSKVVEGKKGPLFSVAQKIAEARGTEDIFILTARPQDAAGPIQEFMKANGIDIPLANITGLGDGTAAAKGRWIAGKAAEGYNDFYFADDAIKNVKAVKDVLSQIDVKSKVQQAKASKRIVFDKVFNEIIEAKTGIESYKDFSAAKAKTVGASKGKFTFFTTPSAEDFLGLLYKTLGKGKVGDAQMAFYKTNLLDPYNRAEIAISQAKVAAGRDYKALKKQFKNIPKTLEKETGIAKYTYQHAIRTYIWNSQGLEVPGLSKRDQKRLTDFVKADPELQAFADQLVNIQKGKPYPKPDKDWTAGNITTDVISGINKVNRAEYLQEWQENVDIIFSEKNMNKLEAAFGAKYVEALKDSLRAMKSGSNRPLGGDRVSNGILDWLNNSVGAIMFLNTRSAVLQTISAVNFVNWGDNNILKAGKAFANQKQFWSDFLTLMNSDYLLERRDGLKINVSESEIADAVEGSKNKVNAAISFLLNKGFVFTRYADSFAIASGGATFYRNRIESLVEQGMDRKAAEEQAFNDFRAIAEENQQSSSPSKISQQQRSLIGRIILQFGNTQLQYVRIQKRAVQDLVNKRGDWKSNISKIVYYGAMQNLLFNALQSGLAWALFDDDEDDEELTEKNKEQKFERTINGAIDSQLKGLGIQGAVIAGVKNALMTIAEQAGKKSPKFEEALDDLLGIAPALGSKIRKIKSAARTVSWNRKDIKEKGFSMDNPAYLAGAQVISAAFNIPLDRAVMKMNNMRNILNPATENWQKVALALGWSGWDVGLPYFGLAEEKTVLTETEKQSIKLFDLNKSDQVKMLLDLGLTKKEIRALTKEQQRVDKIIKLQNKKK